MHVQQSPKGIHNFLRTKTGQRLKSGYASTKKEIHPLFIKRNILHNPWRKREMVGF